MTPIVICLVIVVGVIGFLALAKEVTRCLLYIALPIIVVVGLVLLYDWLTTLK